MHGCPGGGQGHANCSTKSGEKDGPARQWSNIPRERICRGIETLTPYGEEPRSGVSKQEATPVPFILRDGAFALQGFIIIAVTVALRRCDVAVFVIIVLCRNALRLLRFVAGFFRRLALSASSTHVMPFSPAESAFALHADSG